MPLDWDVKLDAVSIRDEIASFTIRESKGSYVRELTLFSANPNFYDLFGYTALPTPRIEVLTKVDVDWVSQGFFFIENPALRVSPAQMISPSVWGRSITAKAGPPFASKITQYYEEDTNFLDVVTDMASRCGLSITSELLNYGIIANTYVIDEKYPIDVITELAEFAGGYVTCTLDGELLVKHNIFHPVTADYTFTDSVIANISENIILPDFGNRVRISAIGGVGTGYQVTVVAVGDGACLAADNVAQGTLLAFVSDTNNNAVPDNTLVEWSTESGVTLDVPISNTGNFLLNNQKHNANDYYSVDVDFPIIDVIGIWAYADGNNRVNFWDPTTGSINEKTITIGRSFSFCDQALRISYITGGCAVNVITAGFNAKDVEVKASVEGAEGTLDVKLGNTCACGSSLSARINPSDPICLGNMAYILIWGTMNNKPAEGYSVTVRKTIGCGELSSENKILKRASITNESSYVKNIVSGVSQVETTIHPSPLAIPAVYLQSDETKSNNLYQSHSGLVIDLDTILSTGTEVGIDYVAAGASLVSWRTMDAIADCEAEIVITMADGTEAGLRQVLNMSAKDCTVPDDIPDYNEDVSDFDPDSFDGGDSNSGGFRDSGSNQSGSNQAPFETGSVPLDPCAVTIVERVVNMDNAGSDNERDAWRFGTHSAPSDCPEEGEDECSCSELCQSEIDYSGGTYDNSQTIHEIVTEEGFEKDTPEYNEAFETEKQAQLATCHETCNETRERDCGDCEPATEPVDLVLTPGDSMEIVCPDGTTGIIEMPEGACGTQTFTVGCCTFEVRSTDGQWVQTYSAGITKCYVAVNGPTEENCVGQDSGGTRWANTTCGCLPDNPYEPGSPPPASDCSEMRCGMVLSQQHIDQGYSLFCQAYQTYEWQCI